MGLPSYQADIEDRAADNRMMIGLFANGTAGAAGISSFIESQRAAAAFRNARQAEAEIRKIEERTCCDVDDTLVWRKAVADVRPLRRQ